MNRKHWIQKALSVCSLTAMLVTFSMVTLAAGPVAGELTVGGASSNSAFVTVNGEPANSGRTISPASTIVTPEGMTAVVNFGKLGKVQLGPNSTFTVNADNNALGGDLTSGSITVLSAAKGVSVRTLNGEVVTVNPGETATAAGAAKQTTPATSGGKWWVFALVAGGAVVAILLAANAGGENRFGASSTTVSPTR